MSSNDSWTPQHPAAELGVTAPRGFRAAGAAAGLKSAGYKDVAIVVNDGPQHVAAAVTTQNRIVAAPVVWTRRAVADGRALAVVLNSGGANACTGKLGYADAVATAQFAAEAIARAEQTDNSGRRGGGANGFAQAGQEATGEVTRVSADDILVCSTGLIGAQLPMDKIRAGVSAAVADLAAGPDASLNAAYAIMTTDTQAKQTGVLGDGYTVGGMAKGAGMLAPELATMLCVLTTDAVLPARLAASALQTACADSFNRIDSDGCMSTNDTVILLASGASEVRPAEGEFVETLTAACRDLARQLISDAEGAAHDVAIRVHGATTQDAAIAVGRAVARSALVKTAIFGNDPNWGRILAALGTVPESVAPFEPDRVDVSMNGVPICLAGAASADRNEVDLAANREVTIDINLHAGTAAATIWTNDLTVDYVHENSAYST